MNRREFLRKAGVAIAGASAGAGFAAPATPCQAANALPPFNRVAIVIDPDDPVADAPAPLWGAKELQNALARNRLSPIRLSRVTDAPAEALCVIAAGHRHPVARGLLAKTPLRMPQRPEAFCLAQTSLGNHPVLLACGADDRGLTYALLELADRAATAAEPRRALTLGRPLVEAPANRVRGIMRLFASDLEDKPWYWDRAFWRRYLSMLATERFNRFNLAFGLGYDFPSGIRDAYFYFAYPFLVEVPGYDVRVTGLPNAERERNLEMLRFISSEAEARGLEFQLGIWTHAYLWTHSPHVNHRIEGLAPSNHAAYCRDALRTLLTACPAVSGVTFRIHGESGVPEGSYGFWKTVFDGLVRCGRTVRLDMHAKGMDAHMIKVALDTGLPVSVSPKFWAEHLGLGYHQASIRPTEMPRPGEIDHGFFSRSSGSRSFLRYGYGDLLVEGRRYEVVHRVWPGTQRLLLWADPALATGYGRAAGFCGSAGMEFIEPLSFKGRKGSGRPGGRDAYADNSLKPAGGPFEKYRYTYRLWGRLLYNPDARPETWRRHLNRQFGAGAPAVESALASASRILPLVTTAHMPSAANNSYWPELYTNMPIVDPRRNHTYGDTPSPKRFGTVSPLDPQLFSRVDDCAGELLAAKPSGKYSPLEVARWLSNLAETASRELARARSLVPNPRTAPFRRLAADVAVQSGLGRFFARKFQAAVLYALHKQTGDRQALQQALSAYHRAREAWAQLASGAQGVYVADITFGLEPQLRGHWQDRLAAMDLDIGDMQRILEEASGREVQSREPEAISRSIQVVFNTPKRPELPVDHLPPRTFQRAHPLPLSLAIPLASAGLAGLSVRLLYRRVNQAEHFRVEPMRFRDGSFRAVISSDYTDSPFSIQYYFGFQRGGLAWLYPGLNATLNNQPYFVVAIA